MKLFKLYLLAGIVSVGLWSCGDSSTTTSDTAVLTDTTTVATVETPAMDNTASPMYLDTAVVPVRVRTTFVKKYAQANEPRWTKYQSMDDGYKTMYVDTDLDTSYYQVNYRMNDMDYITWYTPSGDWVRTSSTINSDKLPATVANVIRKDYEGYNIVKVDEENYKGGKKYEVKLEKGDEKVKIHITSSGQILKLKEKS